MASSKKGTASELTKWESPGVKGSSSTPSGTSINGQPQQLPSLNNYVSDLKKIQNLKFELATKGVKGSSKSPSSEASQRARIVKGDI